MKNIHFSDHVQQMLNDRILPTPVLAFQSAQDMLAQQEPLLLDLLDEDVKKDIFMMLEIYHRDGELIIYGGNSRADHTEFAKALDHFFQEKHILVS